MRKTTKSVIALAACMLSITSIQAKEISDSVVNNYMRSSIYTILVKSDKQNARYEQEAKDAEANKANDLILGTVNELNNTNAKKAANEKETGSLFSLPARMFPEIEIPSQFNNHNLSARILEFDPIREKVTDAEKDLYNPKDKKAKAGAAFKAIGGGLLSAATGTQTNSLLKVDEVDEYLPAVLHKYLEKENVAPLMVAKWYDYKSTKSGKTVKNSWSQDLILDRGRYNFTLEEQNRNAQDVDFKNKLAKTGFDMINNTFVVALNLRFRSYQAVVAEAQAMATGALGDAGSLLGSAASAAAGDGYTVQAVSYLYKLKWNEDIKNKVENDFVFKNASVEDLIKAGICELEYVGKSKASANVRQAITSSKPISDLVKRATVRAIDRSYAKLQQDNEVFRTAMPIIGGDGKGTIYAAIGTKEGLSEGDEYEILEANEDADGHRTYKSIGSVKPIKGTIWNNEYGAEEEIAELADANSDANAVKRTYSEFKGKKGDFTGYYLRLKKKK